MAQDDHLSRSSAGAGAEAAEPEEHPDEQPWIAPQFQPLRAMGAFALTAGGFGLYQYVRIAFWSVPWMGIHDRTPWPAYIIVAAALLISLFGVGVAISIRSPHAKLGFSILAFLACAAVGMGGGRFISYTMRGTLNPPFTLNLKPGDRFPEFALADQTGATHHGPASQGAAATLIYIYRGDFCPFARYELADLTMHSDDFHRTGATVVGISADPVDRSKMLASFLDTKIPLLCDPTESILGPLGLVQRHRDGEPDNAIPAFVIVDRAGIVRWLRAPAHYRELPATTELLDAIRAVTHSGAN
jgi:peroxiredoxin